MQCCYLFFCTPYRLKLASGKENVEKRKSHHDEKGRTDKATHDTTYPDNDVAGFGRTVGSLRIRRERDRVEVTLGTRSCTTRKIIRQLAQQAAPAEPFLSDPPVCEC